MKKAIRRRSFLRGVSAVSLLAGGGDPVPPVSPISIRFDVLIDSPNPNIFNTFI